MSTFRINRISEDVKRELFNIMLSLKDPRIQSSLISILRVEVTRDLSFATVYISSLDGKDLALKAVEGLDSAKGFIKREIGKNLNLRKVPEFIFKASDSIEYGFKINETLKKL
ncbi:MAG: 30S ribosome-binding factor RbfA [Oscillospiraceae bacterium]